MNIDKEIHPKTSKVKSDSQTKTHSYASAIDETIGRKVDKKKHNEAENDGKTDNFFRNLVYYRHFVLKRSYGITGNAVKKEGRPSKSNNYPSIFSLLIGRRVT